MGPLVAILMIAAAECEPLSDMAAKIDFDLRPLPGGAVGPMLAFHNASPPPSEDAWSKAVYGTTKQGVGIILWMEGDSVCGRDAVPPPVWQRLLPLIEGRST